MGRKLEFSREKALHTAMESFWAQGYEQTSMRDLAERLGLHLGSVYNALGDKEHVFEAALRLNFEEQIIPQFQALREAPEPLKAIGAMMTSVMDECAGTKPSPGCFLINSLLEIAEINDGITEALHKYLLEVEDSLVICIENAQKAGQIPAGKNARKHGQFILASFFMMRTMAKLKMPAEQLRNIRDCAFNALTA